MQTGSSRNPISERLAPFIGEWDLEAAIPNAPHGRTVFEWLPGEEFLIQRCEVPHPDAPDGIAIIGFDRDRNTDLQHYFDSRGVARLYEMSFANGVWTLSRTSSDFSPLQFAQRFTGTFSDDGNIIDGAWESSSDGSSWQHDFGISYTRVVG